MMGMAIEATTPSRIMVTHRIHWGFLMVVHLSHGQHGLGFQAHLLHSEYWH